MIIKKVLDQIFFTVVAMELKTHFDLLTFHRSAALVFLSLALALALALSGGNVQQLNSFSHQHLSPEVQTNTCVLTFAC